MASLLRQGVRRIGDSMLQRTRAAVTSPAVAEERRRLVTRRMTTDELPPRARTAAEIQHMKEELYEAVLKARSSGDYFGDNMLLQELSLHVPRPRDIQWRRLRNLRRVDKFAEKTGIVFLAIIVSALGSWTEIYEEAVRRTEACRQMEAERKNKKQVAMVRKIK